MPIQILSRTFQDTVTSVTTSVFKANAGDKIRCIYLIEEKIEVFCKGIDGFTYDFLAKKVTATNFNFLEEGFQVGDSVDYEVTDINAVVTHTTGGGLNQGTAIVTGVTTNSITLSILDPSIAVDDTLRLTAFAPSVERKELHLLVNFKNSASLGFDGASEIDGEYTTFQMLNPQNLPTPVVATQFGKRSGQFEVTNVSVGKPEGVYTGNQYYVNFTVIQSGVYSDVAFNANNYLNLSTGFKFFRVVNDPNTAITLFDDYQSNTGWFDEGYNDEPNLSVLDYGITALAYNQPTTASFKISAPTAMIGMGASYIPIDTNYFQNKLPSQTELGMCQETIGGTMVGLALSGGNPTTVLNPSWALVVNSVTSVSGGFIVSVTFTPNFNGFFDNLAGDRLFRIWAKVDNVNVLVFEDQLYEAPPTDISLTPNIVDLVDARTNSTLASADEIQTFVLEDNVAILAPIQMVESTEQIQSIDVRIYTEETATGNQYTLQSDSFNFSGTPYTTAYLQTQTINKNYNLASGSVKNVATCTPTAPVAGFYDLNLNYPFLIRWQDWITAIGAPATFFGNNNQNWINYTVFGWTMKFEIAKNYGTYRAVYSNDLDFAFYDADPNVTSNVISLKRLSGTVMQNVLDEQMQIEIVQQATGNISQEFVEVTVEPFQDSPRWQLATNYANTNPNNPLTLVSSVVSTNTITTIVNLDTSKMTISGGISITAELKGLAGATQIQERTKKDYNYLKLPPSFDEEERGIKQCCDPELKLASFSSSDPEKNDVTGVAVVLGLQFDSLEIKVYKGSDEVLDATITDMPNQLFGKQAIIEWRDVLLSDGAGCYDVVVSGTLSGVAYSRVYGTYQLFPYNALTSKNQFRLRCFLDKYSSIQGINYEGSGFYDDIRYKGEFGKMQPKTKVDNLVYSDRTTRTIINENVPEYQLETRKMSPRFVDRLVNNLLLNATTIEASDYNAYSPDYISNLPVILPIEGQGAVLEYLGATRDRVVTVTFQKKILNDRMYKK